MNERRGLFAMRADGPEQPAPTAHSGRVPPEEMSDTFRCTPATGSLARKRLLVFATIGEGIPRARSI